MANMYYKIDFIAEIYIYQAGLLEANDKMNIALERSAQDGAMS